MKHWHVQAMKNYKIELDFGYFNHVEAINGLHDYVQGVIVECPKDDHLCIRNANSESVVFNKNHVDDEVFIVECEAGDCSLSYIEGA